MQSCNVFAVCQIISINHTETKLLIQIKDAVNAQCSIRQYEKLAITNYNFSFLRSVNIQQKDHSCNIKD